VCEKLNVAPPSSIILLLDKFPPKQETFLPRTSKCTRFYDKFVKHAFKLNLFKGKVVWCTGLGTILQFHQIVFEFDRDFVSNDFFSNVNVCKMPRS
jgi:hypothetical protein